MKENDIAGLVSLFKTGVADDGLVGISFLTDMGAEALQGFSDQLASEIYAGLCSKKGDYQMSVQHFQEFSDGLAASKDFLSEPITTAASKLSCAISPRRDHDAGMKSSKDSVAASVAP